MPKLTPAQQRTMEILLNTGKVHLAHNPDGRVNPRSECMRKTADQLEALGYITWHAGVALSYLGYYVLTEEGKAFGLTLSDKQSSASRQHHIDTGRYLKYGDREEYAPKPDFQVGTKVQHHTSDDVFEVKTASVTNFPGAKWIYDVWRILPDGTRGDLFERVFISPLTYHVYTPIPTQIPTFPTVRRADGLSVRLVQPGDRVECVVVSTKPGEMTAEVISGLYSPGTIITIKTPTPPEIPATSEIKAKGYRVKFDRIGRTGTTPGSQLDLFIPMLTDMDAPADWLERKIRDHVKKFLTSSYFEVTVDITGLCGSIEFGRFGKFTITKEV
jgi:hypothetical protein